MSAPKIIPLWLFRTIGISMLVLDVLVLLYFTVAESGLFLFFAELLADGDNSYPIVLAFLLTFIVILIPTLIVMLLLRPFSNVPDVKTQMTDLGPFTMFTKTTIDISQFGELPSVFSRVLAFIIDRAIVVLIIALPAAVFVAVTEQTGRGGILYFIMLALFLVFLLAGVVYSYSRDMFGGQSIARRLLKQKVIDVTTLEPIGGWRSFKRELIIHFAPLIFIELILISSNRDKRRLGDNWAKSIVVRDIK